MKLYGSLTRLVNLVFRRNGFDVTWRPNAGTTYTAARDLQGPAGDSDQVLASATSVTTFTNKTFDADGAGNSITNIENADIKAGAAIDAAKIHNGTVSNTEFGFLDGVTSSIQTQLDAKVTGPASATDEALARFDGTTGKLVQNSVVTVSDAGVASGFTQLNVDNLRLDGNTLSSTDTNGNIVLDPDGTGDVRAVGALRSDTALVLEETGAGTDTITLQAPASIAASYTLTLPVDDGTPNQVLTTNGSGVLSWTSSAFQSFEADWVTADGATKTITHNLGTLDIQVEIYDTDDGSTIWVDSVVRTDTNTLDLTASEAPADTWRVTIHST